MIFIINELVYYREEDGAVWNKFSPDRILTLPMTAARMFSFILKSADGKSIVTRDDVFNHIWSNHGLQASNNTLNQYISLIRRTIIELECDIEVIKTLPRLGFIVTADVVIRDENDIRIISSGDDSSGNIHKYRVKMKLKNIFGFVFLVLIFAIAYIFIADSMAPSYVKISNQSKEVLGHIGKCTIYSFNKTPETQISTKIDKISKFIATYDLPCAENINYYYYGVDTTKSDGNYFLSRCVQHNHNNHNLGSCETFYIGSKI